VTVAVWVGVGVRVDVGISVGVWVGWGVRVTVGIGVAVRVGRRDIWAGWVGSARSGARVQNGRSARQSTQYPAVPTATTSAVTMRISTHLPRSRADGTRCAAGGRGVSCSPKPAAGAGIEAVASCDAAPWTARSKAARFRSVPHIGQCVASSRIRAPQVGQRRSRRRRSAFGCASSRESGRLARSGRVARELGLTGCSQNAQRLAVCEIDAPQCGHVRLPLSVRAREAARARAAPARRVRRLGAGSDAPHMRQVRAEALTSAPQCAQRRLPRMLPNQRFSVARICSIQAGNCTSRSPTAHPARVLLQCLAWPTKPC
jgi:hypothetical protein